LLTEEPLYTVHALYYLAEAAGWRSGLRWRLTSRGVFSPDLQRLIVLGRPPRPPRQALERVRGVLKALCRGRHSCGYLAIAAAKYVAYRRLDMSYVDVHVAPRGFEERLEAALSAAGLLGAEETIITPKPIAH